MLTQNASTNQKDYIGMLQGDHKGTKNTFWANKPSPDPKPLSISCPSRKRAVTKLSGTDSLCFRFSLTLILSFLSFPSLSFFWTFLFSLPRYLDAFSTPPSFSFSSCVTQPIWAVWWSWLHRSLSGELSGALLKTQRADYCSCQSH